jgi:Ala-tRNA(Pro) deacylase
MSAAQAAETAHLARSQVAKAVLVRTGDNYMLAVVPASRQVLFDRLQNWLGRPVRLAEERESEDLFADCDLGAIPPVGDAYNLETVLDNSLVDVDEIYFEGGDHRTFVHMRAPDWRKLTKDTAHSAFSA